MIKLSKLTDYAVIVLSVLAQTSEDHCTSVDLAQKTDLPEPTVSKILKLLAKGGLVASLRGSKGGYQLKQKAKAISIAEIVAVIEGPIAVTHCVDQSTECCDRSAICSMSGRWNKVNLAIQETLQKISLEDMMGDQVMREIQLEQGH